MASPTASMEAQIAELEQKLADYRALRGRIPALIYDSALNALADAIALLRQQHPAGRGEGEEEGK